MLIESDQEVDGILMMAGDRGEERGEPRTGRLGIEIRRKLLGELGGIGEREGFREGLEEEIERIYHRDLGDEIDRDGEFARLLWKDEACKPVSIRILLPVHEVLRRRHLERVTFDPRAAMRGRAQPDDVRRQADRPVVAVACDMVEAGEDRHTLFAIPRPLPYYAIFRCNFRADLHPLFEAGSRQLDLEQQRCPGSPYHFDRRRNGGWNRVGRGLQLARRDILRPVEKIAGIEL